MEASKVTTYNNVYNASNTWDNEKLPGKLERAQGEAQVEDPDANKAYDNVGHVLKFYEQRFGWKSIDNQNAPVTSSVHFGEHYQNACKPFPCLLVWPQLKRMLHTSLVSRDHANGLW